MSDLTDDRIRVLFAEDEPKRNRRVIEALEFEGCTVEVASTATECVEKLRGGPYNVLLYDVMMPLGEDSVWIDTRPIDAGVALLTKWVDEELAGMPALPPVVVLTGTTRHRFALETLGVAEYLEKPCGLREIVAAVKRAAGASEAPS